MTQAVNIIHVLKENFVSVFSELLSTNNALVEGGSISNLFDDILNQFIDVNDFIQHLNSEHVIACLSQSLETKLNRPKRLIVAPCSILFTSILQDLSHSFSNIVFVDSHRAGNMISDHRILSPEDVHPDCDDFCIIMTRNTQAIQSYKDKFGAQNCLDLLDVYIKASQKNVRDETLAFISLLNKQDNPILFSSVKPMGTLTSTIDQLAKDGYSTYWIGSEDVKDYKSTGYATPQTSDLNIKDYTIGGLLDILFTFCQLERGTIFFHYESLFPPSWDFKRAAICYAACLAVIRTVKTCRIPNSKAKLVLHMYDAIKPGVINYEAGKQASFLYKNMLAEAEGIVFSSYTSDFGDFVENAMRTTLPRVHCHRYQRIPHQRQERRKDGYHIAIISVLLEEFWEPSRTGFKPYIADLLSKGIHIHYYVGVSSRATAETFKATLPEEDQTRFHLHDPIHSPYDLAYELSQYHAGWSLFNMQIFNDMTTYLDDQFMRDAMGLFTPTTLPSVIWSCAAAGLPVICNRDMRGVVDMLPKGMSIPLTHSEIGNLKTILDKIDWSKVDQCDLSSLDIENQIYRLYDFMDVLHER